MQHWSNIEYALEGGAINFIKRFCGMTTLSEEEEAKREKKRIREFGYDVRESFMWTRLADANAVFIVGATVVIYGLFQ